MIVNNYINWNLIKYASVLSFLIVFNYLLWSFNSWQIIKFINFFLLLGTFIFFFISKKFNDYWYLRIIILLLLIICLGTPTVSADARLLYLFSGKILFYESNLYLFLDNFNLPADNFFDVVNSRPKLPATLSATFAQIVGYWNEIFPKSTNVIIIFPPIIFLISFFKDKVLIMLWLFLMLFFSGKLFIMGMMEGIIAIYFISSILITYKISITKVQSEKKLLYFVMFLFFTTLSLCKNEGTIMILVIILSSIFINFIYEKKINFNFLFIALISLIPILYWKYIIISNNIKFEYLQSGDAIERILERLTNTEDLFVILFFLVTNEKLVLSLIIFIFFVLRYFNKNKKLIFFVSTNFLLYFSVIIIGFFATPRDLLAQLEASSSRTFIPLVLMLIYFSIFLTKNDYFFKVNKSS